MLREAGDSRVVPAEERLDPGPPVQDDCDRGRKVHERICERDAACPISTGRGTRRVHLVRGGGGGGGSVPPSAEPFAPRVKQTLLRAGVKETSGALSPSFQL